MSPDDIRRNKNFFIIIIFIIIIIIITVNEKLASIVNKRRGQKLGPGKLKNILEKYRRPASRTEL